MKKMLVVMMAAVMGLAITSCKQTPKAEGEAAQTEQAAAANPQEAIKAVVEKAIAEGANWSTDQWKDAFKQVCVAMAPSLQKLYDIQKSVETPEGEEPDAAKVAEAMTKMGEVMKEIEPLSGLMEQFDSIAKTTEAGKAVSEDKEFEKECMKAAGLPEDFDM